MTEPFIKWAGGKRQMIHTLAPLVERLLAPGSIYYEPFLGGGAVALSIDPEVPVVATDACEELVEAWRVVMTQTAPLARRLAWHAEHHSKEYYYMVREDHNPETPLERAARFIYLNKMGFNGLYRKNAAGRFNVPVGRGRPTSIPTHGELQAVAARMRNWVIEHSDFEHAVDQASEGDVVYADPPYDGTFDYSSRFGDVGRARLSACLRRAARRGVGVIVTDADTPLVRRLYSWARLTLVDERRSVSADAERRGAAACVLAVRP